MTTAPYPRSCEQSKIHRSPGRIAPAVAVVLLFLLYPTSLLAKRTSSIPEEIEWTWEVRPTHPDARLPNVLLLGDSISRNYFPQVTEDLAGIANVYLMTMSTSVGDPRLAHQLAEFAEMEGVHFSVVHFNNGMHGWGYSESQYNEAFPGFLREVRKLVGRNGTMIWATTTPVRLDAPNGATNSRVDARNAIAKSLVQAAGIAVDDQHALMMQHQDSYEDSVHFNAGGATLQGDQAAATIKAALADKHRQGHKVQEAGL